MSLPFLHKYPTPVLLFFRFPSLSFLCLSLEKLEQCRFQGWPFKRNQCHFPVYATSFTSNEIQQLSSFFQSTDLVNPNSCLEGSSRAVYSFDERKERKKISNQESARKARWRKKKHLESLADEAKWLSVENLELKKELGFVTNKWQAVCRENDLLLSESTALSARLSNLCRILAATNDS